MGRLLEDYALIGNLQSAALVSRNGSIDWLCFPRFDSPACFAALLGSRDNGRWLIAPRDKSETTRAYRKDTLVLETEHVTGTGRVLVIDAMIPRAERPTVIRVVRGLEGVVQMSMELVVRYDYGSIVPWVTRDAFGGLRAVAGPDALRLHTTVPLKGADLKTFSEFEVREGEEIPFVLLWSASYEESPRQVEFPTEAIDHCAAEWRDWIAKCTYSGPYQEAVRRSLITLKALTYEPTGGIVAAPTTSLPEEIGGVRNWDYRYCWVRDSTFILYAFLSAGFRDEARHWQEWLVHAVAGTPSQLNLMYGLRGERRLTEIELPWLSGFEGSRPVRIGNGAYSQLQMDVFGELMDSFQLGRESGLATDGPFNSWRIETHLIDFVAENWHKPDNGIWEVRGDRQHFTHSRVMSWVAVQRAVEAIEEFGLQGPLRQWRALADEIHAEICEHGFDRERGTFTQSYGSKNVDASLLMLPIVGFLPCHDERIRGTVAAIEQELMVNGFVRRYATEHTDDGLPGGEGTFLACTFWLADNLCLQGRIEEAQEIFERVLAIRNDVGLLAEEYEAVQKRQTGNFPQAFSHVGLINTAFNLDRADAGPASQRAAHLRT
ncbi:MAG TPA: glycoside hydrolase family 15 protein [Thermoanaerobaculia bacterium]|nr:glycoside hydrolase family 15 protein [Thermoanaerobaculia bacterium]